MAVIKCNIIVMKKIKFTKYNVRVYCAVGIKGT